MLRGMKSEKSSRLTKDPGIGPNGLLAHPVHLVHPDGITGIVILHG